MSKTKLIITLGTRDLQINSQSKERYKGFYIDDPTGRIKEKILKSPREFGAELQEYWVNFRDEVIPGDLLTPMLTPAMAYVQEREGDFDLVLVATDQDEQEHTKNYWKQDSIEIAKFLKLMLAESFKGEIEILPVKGQHIQEMGAVYNWMRDTYFKDRVSIIYPEPSTRFYVLPQGGIDSINTSLLLNCIEFYQDAVFLRKSESSKEVEEQVFPRQYRQRVNAQILDRLLEHYQFFAVKEALNDDSLACKLAEYAHYRYQLNLQKAFEVWKKVKKPLASSKDKLDSADLKQVELREDRGSLLNVLELKRQDLLASLLIDYDNGDFVAVLTKLFTLVENFLDYYLQDFLPPNHQVYKRDKEMQEPNDEWVRQATHLDESFDLGLLPFSKNILRDTNPSVFQYKKIFNALVKKGIFEKKDLPDLGKFEKAWKTLIAIKKFRDNLNHGGKSYSETEVNAELEALKRIKDSGYNKNNYYDSIQKLLNALKELYGMRNPHHFELIARLIKRTLR